MNKIIALYFFIFMFYPQLSVSQKLITGVVKDEQHHVIPFANVYIKGTSLGTISNEDGMFNLHIPKRNLKDSLVCSYMGFETKIFDLTSFINKDIYLDAKTLELDEVVIKTIPEVTVIVKRAFDKYNENFPTKPSLSTGFIRHTERTKKEYKWMVEAIIEVYDPSFTDNKNQTIKVNTIEVRKSLDNRQMDTLTAYRWYIEDLKGLSFKKVWQQHNQKISNVPIKELKEAINYFDNHYTLSGWKDSFLHNLFNTDVNKIRYFNQKKATLKANDLFKKFSFTLDTILAYNDDYVYKIKLTPPKKEYKEYGENKAPVGWLFIRQKDYAIVEFEYTVLIIGKYSTSQQKIRGTNVLSSIKLKFKDIDGKMHLSYMRHKKPKINRIHSVFALYDTDSTSNLDELYYFTEQEVLFSEIITNQDTIEERIQYKIWDDNLFYPRLYNPEFWKTNNILLESEKEKKIINDLEKKVSLKKQFENK